MTITIPPRWWRRWWCRVRNHGYTILREDGKVYCTRCGHVEILDWAKFYRRGGTFYFRRKGKTA